MNLGEAIKEYRKEHGISQQAFADACGLSKPYISQLENNRNPRTGEPPIPSADTFIKVAKAMHISLQELLKSVDQNQPISIKVISESDPSPTYEAAAGPGIIGDGYPTGEANLRLDDDQVLVTVRGRSMEPTLMDGDLVVIEATNIVDNQQIALVKINGDEATLKRVRIQEDGITLIGDNVAEFSPRFYKNTEVRELPVTIEGVVVRLIREIK